MNLSINVVCAVLNYQRIDDGALKNLKLAEFKVCENVLETFKKKLGFETDSIAIIKKCNAIIVVITFNDDLSHDYIKGRLLHTWNDLSSGGISHLKRDIRFFENVDAIKFLAECSVGLHSVTVGDSQVLSQVIDGLKNRISSSDKTFDFIIDWIKDIAEECRLKSGIFNGNTSLERIACECVIQKTEKGSVVAIIGYGKSGKLVAKILNKEHNVPILVVNRTLVDLEKETFNDNALYQSYDAFCPAENVKSLVVTISNSRETKSIINKIVTKFPTKDILFVDLSTPPLLLDVVNNFIGIESLSEIAQKNIGERKDAVNKVKKIIDQQINNVVNRINNYLAAIYVQEQKNFISHLK